jgi:hypothetical protein
VEAEALVSGGGVVELLVLAGVWLLTGGLADVADAFTSLCGTAEVVVLLAALSGGVVVLLVELLLDEVLLGEVAVLLEVVSGGTVLVAGGCVVLLGDVLLLGLFTSLCGIVPVLLPVLVQSDEIIFTLLTLSVFELEDEGLVLPLAVPVALPLPEVDPVTWII